MTVPDEATRNYIEKRIKAGFGQGQGEHYRPWIMVGDFSSSGTSSRLCSHRYQREHHFFSQLEVSAFYLIDWHRDVVDIQEQYPLLPIYDTILIADRMGVTHPRTNKPISMLEVMTTDTGLAVKSCIYQFAFKANNARSYPLWISLSHCCFSCHAFSKHTLYIVQSYLFVHKNGGFVSLQNCSGIPSYSRNKYLANK